MKNAMAVLLCILICNRAGALTVNLDIRIPNGVVSETVKGNMVKNIEAARDLWSGKLGFSRCYPDVEVTVTVEMIKAEDQPARAFMDATTIQETFIGSRQIKNGGTAKITFKSRPYRDDGDPSRKADTTWFLTPNPMAVNGVLWPGPCDIWQQPCKSVQNGGQFDFFTHMAHEFGHVFGFVGTLLAAGIDVSGGEPGYFRGVDSEGKPFSFQFSGNTSHAKTSVMSLGFSEMQRALPNRVELEALRNVFGYASAVYLDTNDISIGAGTSVAMKLTTADNFTVTTVELGTFPVGSAGTATVHLTSPGGTVARIGQLRAGWAKEGFVRPDIMPLQRASYSPGDTLSVFRGKGSAGTWTVRIENNGQAALSVAGVVVRLGKAEASRSRAPVVDYAVAPGQRGAVGVLRALVSGTPAGFDLSGRGVKGANATARRATVGW